MSLNRIAKLSLGALTVAPLVHLFVYLTYWIPKLATVGQQGGLSEPEFFSLFTFITRLHALAIVLGLALIAYYVTLALRSPGVPAEKRHLWATLLVVGNLVMMPAFWYLYVWRRAPAKP